MPPTRPITNAVAGLHEASNRNAVSPAATSPVEAATNTANTGTNNATSPSTCRRLASIRSPGLPAERTSSGASSAATSPNTAPAPSPNTNPKTPMSTSTPHVGSYPGVTSQNAIARTSPYALPAAPPNASPTRPRHHTGGPTRPRRRNRVRTGSSGAARTTHQCASPNNSPVTRAIITANNNPRTVSAPKTTASITKSATPTVVPIPSPVTTDEVPNCHHAMLCVPSFVR